MLNSTYLPDTAQQGLVRSSDSPVEVKGTWRHPQTMGGAFTAAVYDFTPIYSRLWQSVTMAVGYPGCGTAIPHLSNSPYFTTVSFPSSGHIEISKPFRSFPSILIVFIIPSSCDKMLHFW